MKALRISRPDGGPDGDVLQVGVVAAQPPGRRHRLGERGVHAAGVGVDELRQCVDVGSLELRQTPPLQHLARQIVDEGELFEHVHRGRGRLRLAGTLAGRELQLLEEDCRQLARRVDVERLAGEGVDLRLQRRQLRVHRHRLRAQRVDVEQYPGAFQVGEHGYERQLEVAVQRLEPVVGQPAAEVIGHLQRQVAPLARVLDHRVDRHVGGAERLRALADDLLERDRLVADRLQGQVAQVVARAGGVHQIAGNQRVEVEPVQGDAVTAQEQNGLLEVVPDLRHPGVGERSGQGAQRVAAPETRVFPQRPVSEGHVARVMRTGRERDPDQVGLHRTRSIREHREADPPGASDGVDQGGELGLGPYHAVVLLDGRCRRCVLGGEGAEAERREQREAVLGRRTPVAQRLRLERHRHVGPDGHQLAALARVVRVLLERRSLLFLRDVRRVFQQRIQGAVRRNQLAGALFTDAGHALDVVDGVAHQGENVDHPFGPDAELLLDAVRVVPRTRVARVEHGHAVADELEEVLVAGDDRYVEPGRARLRGQRADDVVGLERLVREDGHAQRLARLVHVRDLLAQIGRHRRTIGLVVGGQLVPESRSPDVEGGGDERRPLVGDELAQHVDEAEDGVRRPAVRRRQPPDRVESAIHLRAAVESGRRYCWRPSSAGSVPPGCAPGPRRPSRRPSPRLLVGRSRRRRLSVFRAAAAPSRGSVYGVAMYPRRARTRYRVSRISTSISCQRPSAWPGAG